jgi:hypothetical protein
MRGPLRTRIRLAREAPEPCGQASEPCEQGFLPRGQSAGLCAQGFLPCPRSSSAVRPEYRASRAKRSGHRPATSRWGLSLDHAARPHLTRNPRRPPNASSRRRRCRAAHRVYPDEPGNLRPSHSCRAWTAANPHIADTPHCFGAPKHPLMEPRGKKWIWIFATTVRRSRP